MTEWIQRTLEAHGLAGLVIAGLTVAIVTLWRRNNQLQEHNDHLEQHRAKMLEKLLDAAKTKAQKSIPPAPNPQEVARSIRNESQTGYSISTPLRKRTRE